MFQANSLSWQPFLSFLPLSASRTERRIEDRIQLFCVYRLDFIQSEGHLQIFSLHLSLIGRLRYLLWLFYQHRYDRVSKIFHLRRDLAKNL